MEKSRERSQEVSEPMEGFPEEWWLGVSSGCAQRSKKGLRSMLAGLSMPHAPLLGESALSLSLWGCELLSLSLSLKGALRVAGTLTPVRRTEMGPHSDSRRYCFVVLSGRTIRESH